MVYDETCRNTSEKRWSNNYHFLQGKGYVLRPRYHPDWTASWLGTNCNQDYCEDSVIPNVCQSIASTNDALNSIYHSFPTFSMPLNELLAE